MGRLVLLIGFAGLVAAAPTAVAAELERALGKALFERAWVTAPASTQATDGLGPLYNGRACASCHRSGGRGTLALASAGEVQTPALVLRLADDPVYGQQLQTAAIPDQLAEGRIRIAYQALPMTLADGARFVLHRPSYQPTALAYGTLRAAHSARLAPALHGLGWLARIPEQAILSQADPQDRDGDGVSGRPPWLRSADDGWVLGRFGWKAATGSLAAQTAQALALDMGLSSPLRPEHAGDCTAHQAVCRAAPHGASARLDGVEVAAEIVRLIVHYVAALAPPPATDIDPQVEGAKLFATLGCASCHWPSYRLTDTTTTIRPYTDLLLHDLGEGLADGVAEGAASGREWRTAPLWGLGARADALLHDGRARSIVEAILWHDGEAQAVRGRFARLRAPDQIALIEFLQRL